MLIEMEINRKKIETDHYEALKIKEELQNELTLLVVQGQQLNARAEQAKAKIMANNGILNYLNNILNGKEEKKVLPTKPKKEKKNGKGKAESTN